MTSTTGPVTAVFSGAPNVGGRRRSHSATPAGAVIEHGLLAEEIVHVRHGLRAVPRELRCTRRREVARCVFVIVAESQCRPVAGS